MKIANGCNVAEDRLMCAGDPPDVRRLQSALKRQLAVASPPVVEDQRYALKVQLLVERTCRRHRWFVDVSMSSIRAP